MTTNTENDVFVDEQGRPRIVRGAIIVSGSPRMADLAGRVGFEIVWIEMEHGQIDYEKAEAICTAAQAGGAAAAIRISSVQRQHVLRALEVGADMVVAPMVNTRQDAEELVGHGKFPPLGNRGYNTRSRGMDYGLGPPTQLMVQANQRTHLIAQIETVEAVENVEDILAVDGVSGILIGPGDLSVSMGKAGKLADPELVETVLGCIGAARRVDKHSGILVGPGPLLEAVVGAGADLVFYAGDVMDLGRCWPELLAKVTTRKEGL